MNKVEYKYFSTGDEITLQCGCKAVFWNGPAFENTRNDVSKVREADIYGESKTWNISIYTHGASIANTLPHETFRRLHLVGVKFDLHITNLSSSDEGLYLCDTTMTTANCFWSNARFILQKKSK